MQDWGTGAGMMLGLIGGCGLGILVGWWVLCGIYQLWQALHSRCRGK